MGSRLDLQTRLESIPGVRKVYFQPPESIKIDYPCIIYERSRINTKFADNLHYIDKTGYTVTVIDRNPDSAIPAYVGQFEYVLMIGIMLRRISIMMSSLYIFKRGWFSWRNLPGMKLVSVFMKLV